MIPCTDDDDDVLMVAMMMMAWKPLHLIGGAHDDVALDDVVEPLLEIGLVDAHDDCLIMALEP